MYLLDQAAQSTSECIRHAEAATVFGKGHTAAHGFQQHVSSPAEQGTRMNGRPAHVRAHMHSMYFAHGL